MVEDFDKIFVCFHSFHKMGVSIKLKGLSLSNKLGGTINNSSASIADLKFQIILSRKRIGYPVFKTWF